MVPFSIIFVGEFCVTIYSAIPYEKVKNHKNKVNMKFRLIIR